MVTDGEVTSHTIAFAHSSLVIAEFVVILGLMLIMLII